MEICGVQGKKGANHGQVNVMQYFDLYRPNKGS